MSTVRPPRAPRSARERVEQRRALRRLSKQRRSGQLVYKLSGLAILIVLSIVSALFILSLRARETLQGFEQADPRQARSETAQPQAASSNPFEAPFTILLIGVDRRDDPNEGVRGDTLIVVAVNPAEQRASMLSIPRDSLVEIPHVGTQKINSAYGYGYNNAVALYGEGTTALAGGGALAAETVERFLGIQIDYIAQVDFGGFEQIIDTLGGILVDVPQPLLDSEYPTENYGVERIYIPAGLQVLDGATALKYARSRHSGSDFDRSQRQQQILRAILDEVRRRELLNQVSLLPQLANDLQQNVQTTLPLSDLDTLTSLANLALKLDLSKIEQLSINPNDVTLLAENGSDLYWEPTEVRMLAQRLIAGPDAKLEVARIQVQNGTDVSGLAGRMTSRLEQEGFLTLPPGDAPGYYEQTILIDYSNKPETLARLRATLGLPEEAIRSASDDNVPPVGEGVDLVLVLGADYQQLWARGQ
jgi:cell envelope-related function transcriptional attenuator common domain